MWAGTREAWSHPRPKAGGATGDFRFGGIDTLNFTFGRLRYSSVKNPETKGYYNVDIDHWVLTGLKKEEEIPVAFQNMAKRKGLEWLWDRLTGTNTPTNRPTAGR